MTYDGYQALIKQLEAYAQKHPGAYRARVALLTCLGYASLALVLGVIGAGIAGGLWALAESSRGAGVVLGKLLIGLGALSLLVLRALWVRLSSPTGIALTRQDAPELFELLDRLRRALKAPAVRRVLLTSDFTAAVVQIPRLGFLGWCRNDLVLGLPLMQVLSPPQLDAVVALEFGHLSRAHGGMAGWIYRVRITWDRLVGAMHAHRRWGAILFERFLGWYVPYFNAYSFVLAREQEYEADAQAARLAGSIPAREALVTLAVVGRFLDRSFWPALDRLTVKQATPPKSPLEDLARTVKTGMPPDDARRWLKEEMSRLTGYADTHPSLKDRLAALAKESKRTGDPWDLETWPHLRGVPRVTASDYYLGEIQREFRRRLEAEWVAARADEWKARHEAAQVGQRRLLALAQKVVVSPLSVEEQWEQARWAEELRGEGEALPLLESLLTTSPNHARANFALGRILLDRSEARGMALIERAMGQAPDLIQPGCRLIADFQSRRGNEPDLHRYLRRTDEQAERLGRAEAQSQTLRPTDRLVPHGLSAAAVVALRSQLPHYPRVAEAYLVRRVMPDCPELPFYVLAVVPLVRWYERRNDKIIAMLTEELTAAITPPRHTSLFVLHGSVKRGMVKALRRVHQARIFTRTTRAHTPPNTLAKPRPAWLSSGRKTARRLAVAGALSVGVCAVVTFHHHPSPNCGDPSVRAHWVPEGQGFVYLVPLGDFPDRSVQALTDYYRHKYDVTIDRLPRLALADGLRDPQRGQVMGQRLLARVQQQYGDLVADSHATLIALTADDIYLENQEWPFAFNTRSVRPRVAVVSTARLDPGFWETHLPHGDWFGLDATDRAIARCRLQKLVTRNLGVLHFQQPFNDDPASPLVSSLVGLDDLDRAAEEF
jgi:Zn-dependent protease with chaperone function/predicted Zn-dependent protease